MMIRIFLIVGFAFYAATLSAQEQRQVAQPQVQLAQAVPPKR